MSNEFYNATGAPGFHGPGSSAQIRAEFAALGAGLDKMPPLAGNGGKYVRVNAGGTGLEVDPSGGFVSKAGDTMSGNLFVPNVYFGNTTASAGTIGIPSGSGANIVLWGDAAAGTGGISLVTGGVGQVVIPRVASAVNYLRLFGAATGGRVAIDAQGADTNVGVAINNKGAGDFAVFGNGGAQLVVSPAASSTRYIIITGSAAGNPAMYASAGQLQFNSAVRNITGGVIPQLDTPNTYYGADKVGWQDNARPADGRIHEFLWNSGSLLGRFVNDAYSATSNWLVVTGVAGGVSQVSIGGTNIGFTGAVTINGSLNGLGATFTGLQVNGAANITAAAAIGGLLSANASAAVTGVLNVASSGSTQGIQLTDTGVNGANIRLVGNGGATPGKYIRATAGAFQILNNAYSNAILSITDAGVISDIAGFELGYKGLPGASVTTGAFAATDRGKCVYANGGVTIPNSVMGPGDVVVIQNTTGSPITITKSVATAYNCNTGGTLGATFTLGARGRAALLFESGTVVDVSGNIS